MAEDKYLSLEEAAERLGVTIKTLHKYLREGSLKGDRRPKGGKWLRVKESDIEEFITGQPQAEPEDTGGKGDPELEGIQRQIAVAEAQGKLELANRQIATFEELDGLVAKTKEEAIRLGSERERVEAGVEQNEVDRRANEEKAMLLTEREEEDKQQSLYRINRIAEKQKEKAAEWEAEDKRRAASHKAQLTFLDGLAIKIYNPPPQAISNRLQEDMVALFEPLMESYGLKPEFDGKGAYVSLEDRYGVVGVQVVSGGRRKAEVFEDGASPSDIKLCYKECVGVYNWMRAEPNYGYQFCASIDATARHLSGLVKDKSDKDLKSERDAILLLFQHFHRAIMVSAEAYQNVRMADWSQVADWLCKRAELLEVKLGVGVMMDEDENLPLRM